MFIKINFLLFYLSFGIIVFAQNEEVLVTINGNKITKNEFIQSCEKNKDNKWGKNKDSLRKYLDQFIDFKMKVIEAKSRGLDKSERYNEEADAYYKKLLGRYLTDQEALDVYVKQTYERSKTEVWIKQILLRIDPNASAKDSLIAYQKALNIRKRLLAGDDFKILASQVSDDPSAAINGGDLWYVKASQIPYAVENYIYSNTTEKISYPIRSKYGYHIIEIVDKRPNQGKFKVSHILLSHSINDKDTSDVKIKEKADSIYQLAINGADFAQLAQKYSCDKGTSSQGGELPWFETGKMPREFEIETTKLLMDNAISKPVKTQYGWHIIKRIAHESNPSFEQIKEQLYNLVLDSEKGEIASRKEIEKLKKENRFNDNNSLSPFYSLVDSTIFEGNWEIPILSDLENQLFSYDKEGFDQKDFARFLAANQKKSYPIPIINYVDSRYNEFIDSTIINSELKNIGKKYPEFNMKMENFKEKILVNDLMEKAIWEKAENDETGLMNFYRKNMDNYNKLYVADVCIFSYGNDKASKIEKHYNKIKEGNLTGIELEKNIQISIDKEFKLIKCSRFTEGDNEKADYCINLYKTGNLKKDQRLVFLENENILVLLNEGIKKDEKSLNEVKSLLVSDYEDYLEKGLLNELKLKQSVVINEEVFKSIKFN